MKRLGVLLMCIILCLSSVMTVSAANGEVIYDGKAKEFIFKPGSEESLTDLFPDFKSVMPGDSLTQKITVKNEKLHNAKIKIYIRALGAQEDSKDFLSKLNLKVKKSEENETAYMFDAAADQREGLANWVYLGTLYSGGEVNLDVTLDVPTTLDNDYKNQVGFLDWEFMIEEFPVDPDDPKTGDDSKLWLWLAVLAGSGVVVFVILAKRKKKD